MDGGGGCQKWTRVLPHAYQQDLLPLAHPFKWPPGRPSAFKRPQQERIIKHWLGPPSSLLESVLVSVSRTSLLPISAPFTLPFV